MIFEVPYNPGDLWQPMISLGIHTHLVTYWGPRELSEAAETTLYFTGSHKIMFYKTVKHEKKQVPLQKRKKYQHLKKKWILHLLPYPCTVLSWSRKAGHHRKGAGGESSEQHTKWANNYSSSYTVFHHKNLKISSPQFQNTPSISFMRVQEQL